MIFTKKELVTLLRHSVDIQYKEDGITDPEYLAMDDEDILLYLKMGASRIYPGLDSLDNLPDSANQYGLILLAKIELYHALAVRSADDVDLGADNNTFLKQSQRFDHYMKLVGAVKEQYNDFLESEGSVINTYDVLHSKYSHTVRNYNKQLKPEVRIRVADITNESFDILWEVEHEGHFGKFMVFLSKGNIINQYMNGAGYASKIAKDAIVVKQTHDFRDHAKHFSGLDADTTYHVAVISVCRNGVWGYKETVVQTLEAFNPAEDDFDLPEYEPIEELATKKELKKVMDTVDENYNSDELPESNKNLYNEVGKLTHMHSYDSEWKMDEVNHWKECNCGEKSEPTAHSFDGWVTVKEPTEEEEGEQKRVCNVCQYEETKSVPKIEHVHSYSSEWGADENTHYHLCSCGDKSEEAEHVEDAGLVEEEPTEESEGRKVFKCSVCGRVLREESIPKLSES